MTALRPGTALFWEAARLPFNLVLLMFGAVGFEWLFQVWPADVVWSYVWSPSIGWAVLIANGLYTLVHPLDRLLQASHFQRREGAGRVALFCGLTLVSVALVVRVVSDVIAVALF